MSHSPTYYRVRSVVRVLAVLVPLTIALALVALAVSSTVDNRPSCPVVIHSDSTWSSDFPVNVAECVAPNLMVLHPDNTWEWVK